MSFTGEEIALHIAELNTAGSAGRTKCSRPSSGGRSLAALIAKISSLLLLSIPPNISKHPGPPGPWINWIRARTHPSQCYSRSPHSATRALTTAQKYASSKTAPHHLYECTAFVVQEYGSSGACLHKGQALPLPKVRRSNAILLRGAPGALNCSQPKPLRERFGARGHPC